MGLQLVLFGTFLTDAAAWVWIALQVLIALGMVIFVHELGHFAVAKLCGVKCEKFYLGFDVGGKRFFRFRWGETEYGVGIIPLGGYVKMLGQEDNPSRVTEEIERAKSGQSNAETGAVAGGYDPRSYLAKPVWQRMAIISAGVVMNVIFAFVVATIAYTMGVPYMPCVPSTVSPGGPAWQAGLRAGDEILRIGSIESPRFQDLKKAVTLGAKGEPIELLVRRRGVLEPISISIHPDRDGELPSIGVGGAQTLTLGETPTLEFTPAGQSKPSFAAGDTIVAIRVPSEHGAHETEIADYAQMQRVLMDHPRETLTFVAMRGVGDRVAIEVGPYRRRTLGMVMRMGKVTAVRAGSPAAKAGIKEDDLIVKVDGINDPIDPLALPEWLRQAQAEDRSVRLTIARGGETIELPAIDLEAPTSPDRPYPGDPLAAPALGVAYRVLNRFHAPAPGSPLYEAGVRSEGTLLKVEFLPTDEHRDYERLMDEDKRLYLEFGEEQPNVPYFFAERLQMMWPDTKLVLTIAPGEGAAPREVPIAWTDSDEFNYIRGVRAESMIRIRTAENWSEAASLGYRETIEALTMVYTVLQRLAGGDLPLTVLGGPGTIADAAGRSASSGIPELLIFLTMLSANLAVVNFLPIPLLDGGHMVFLAYEGLFRKPANERVQLILHYAGFCFILALMAFVIFLDAERGISWLWREWS